MDLPPLPAEPMRVKAHRLSVFYGVGRYDCVTTHMHFPHHLPSTRVTADPVDILWHYATGYMPDFLDGKSGAVGWVRWPHRGVQRLDQFKIPRKQKPYVMSPEFELRFDQAFEEVVRACADTQ